MMQSALRRVAALLLLLPALGCSKDKPAPENPLAKRTEAGRHDGEGFDYPLPYRLFVPDGYDPGQSYPIVLYLHGAGSWGDDNQKQLDENVGKLIGPQVQAIAKSFVLAPHCPHGDQWVNGDHEAPYTNYVQTDVPESDAAKMTMIVLDRVMKTYAIDPARVYVTGPSMGGAGTWDFVTRYVGRFAAAVPVTGVNDPSRAAAIKALPIWAFHGAKDNVAPASNTRAMVAALRKLGSPVKYTEVPDAGHNSWDAAYNNMDMLRWLFAQHR